MVSWIISRLVVLIFGTLYPAYYSYKAVKSKDIKEYVKWMMYWIIFALFTTAETFTDIFLCWDRVPCRRDYGASACRTSPLSGVMVPLLPPAPLHQGRGGPAANTASPRCPGVLPRARAAQAPPRTLRSRFRKKSTSSPATETT
uniref:Receptor expression-enhancing protein n=1 Tax=Peromyscus maniculatus bairdii TaxID=230844 RepID=A0A8C8W2H7_PERMB